MSEHPPEVRCSLCGEQYTKRGMSNHLRACRSDHVAGEQDTFHLRAEGAYRPDFWVHFDFGTTTDLSLRVVERDDHHCGFGVIADYGDAPVRLLARNEMPDIRCGVCGDEATAVCSGQTDIQEGWLCYDSQADLDCRPDSFLPLVNSPRVGMCAYPG